MVNVDGSPRLVEYNGTALVNGSIMRVTVLAREGGWKHDAMKAVHKAGGYNVELGDSKPEATGSQRLRSILWSNRISYDVTFTHDSVLSGDSRASITILLKSDLSRFHDGEFQRDYKRMRSRQAPGQNLITPLRCKP